MSAVRAFLWVLSIAAADAATGWLLTAFTPSGLLAVAALVLAGAVVVLLAAMLRAGLRTPAPLPQRTAALRRKSWGAVFQRQLNPDAAGRARPRAPSAAPAAA